MKAKTIQYMNHAIPINRKIDRYDTAEPLRSILVNLVERGEISRWRGDETSYRFTEDATILEIVWNSRAGAEEYALQLKKLDPTRKLVFDIKIEDIVS